MLPAFFRLHWEREISASSSAVAAFPASTPPPVWRGVWRMRGLFSALCLFVLACGQTAHAQYGGPLGVDPDRRYNENSFLNTHDAFANIDEGFSFAEANQQPSLTRQLSNNHVRVLTLRVYHMWQWNNGPSVWSYAYEDAGTWHRADNVTIQAVSSSSPPYIQAGTVPDLYMAHGPDVGFQVKPQGGWNRLLSAFQEVKAWADLNPDQVVTLALDKRSVTSAEINDALNRSGLLNIAFFAQQEEGAYVSNTGVYTCARPDNLNTPYLRSVGPFTASDGKPWNVSQHGWPTLRQLVDGVNGSGSRRIVITLDDNGLEPKGTGNFELYEKQVWQNDAGTNVFDWSKSLFNWGLAINVIIDGVNYNGPINNPFIAGFGVRFDLINSEENLRRKAEIIQNHSGRLLNWISIDAVGRGGEQQVVTSLNALWARKTAQRWTPFHDWFDRANLAGTGFHPARSLIHNGRLFGAAWGTAYEFAWDGRALAHNQLESASHIQHWSNSNVRLAAYGNTLILGVAGNVYALDMSNGLQQLWKRELSASSYNCNVMILPDGRLFAAHNGYVYELNLQNGSVLHQNGLSGTGNHEVRLAYAYPYILAGTNGYVCQMASNNIEQGFQKIQLTDDKNGALSDVVTLISDGRDTSNPLFYAGCQGCVFRIAPIANYGAVNITHHTNFRGDYGQQVDLTQAAPGGSLYAASAAGVVRLSPDDLSWQSNTVVLPFADTAWTHLVGFKGRVFAGCQSYTYELDAEDLGVLHINPLQDGSYPMDASYHPWWDEVGTFIGHSAITFYGDINYDVPDEVDLTAATVGDYDFLVSGANGYLFANRVIDVAPAPVTVGFTSPSLNGWFQVGGTGLRMNFSIPAFDGVPHATTIFYTRSDKDAPRGDLTLPDPDSDYLFTGGIDGFPEGVTNVAYYSKNRDGVESGLQTVAVKIDSVPPVSQGQIVGKNIQLTGSDATSGLWKFVGWFGQEAPKEYIAVNNTVTLPENSVLDKQFSFYAVDFAGNREATPHVLDLTSLVPTPHTTLTMLNADGSLATTHNGWYTTSRARFQDTAVFPGDYMQTHYYPDDATRLIGPRYPRAYSAIPQDSFHVGDIITLPIGAHTLYFLTDEGTIGDPGPSFTEALQSQAVNIDLTPPTTISQVQGTQVTLSATDADSGVDQTLYVVDGGAETTYTGPFSVSAGTHFVSFYSRDRAGNQEILRFLNVQTPIEITGSLKLTLGGITHIPGSTIYTQQVTVTCTGSPLTTLLGPLNLVLSDLSDLTTLTNATGVTSVFPPLGSPYVALGGSLGGGQSVKVTLRFNDPSQLPIHYTPHILAGSGTL